MDRKIGPYFSIGVQGSTNRQIGPYFEIGKRDSWSMNHGPELIRILKEECRDPRTA